MFDKRQDQKKAGGRGFLLIFFGFLLLGGTFLSEPSWIQKSIKKFQSEPLANPPASILKCTYQKKTVYLISSPCCDQYHYAYTQGGEVLCAPSGGFTGRGDGGCPNFPDSGTECEAIWQDSRREVLQKSGN